MTTASDLLDGVVARNLRATTRLITLLEKDPAALHEIADRLGPLRGNTHIVGFTGPPGVGKSTLVGALISALRARSQRVAVLAVDPTSPLTGGAILGDRIRMQKHVHDSDVFIRSLATRGQLGGLSGVVPLAVQVLDAAGYDYILVETVGVGQSEVDIWRQADTNLVVTAPGLGDGVQAIKAGILETADLFVVSKADLPGADALVKDLRQMQALGGRHSKANAWRPPVVEVSADRGIKEGFGIPDLAAQIERHREWLRQHRTGEREVTRARRDIEAAVAALMANALRESSDELQELSHRVSSGRTSALVAAKQLLASALV